MRESYIFDSVRTPRGKAKPNGGLRGVTPIQLGKTVLAALVDRTGLDATEIEDVLFGCVEAVGEQGGDIARIAAL